MKRSVICFAVCVCVLMFACLARAEIKIGVLANHGVDKAVEQWSPLGDYLTSKMGEKVVFVPLLFADIKDFCRNSQDQFLLVNPEIYVSSKRRFGARALLTLDERGFGSSFGGVIFARKDSGIAQISDLRDKRLVCVKFSGAGGWMFQKGEMLRQGIVPEEDCKSLAEAGTQDDVVYAVRDGRADAGTPRTGHLEAMHKTGKINMNDFVLINPVSHPGLTVWCSTPLYPHWVLAGLIGTNPRVADSLKKVLISIPPDHGALVSAKLVGFIEPLDYGPLEELVQFVKSRGVLGGQAQGDPKR